MTRSRRAVETLAQQLDVTRRHLSDGDALGLFRGASRPPSGISIAVSSQPAAQGGQTRVEHVTLDATADQTIAAGGGPVEWAASAGAPAQRRGFACLDGYPMTQIPVCVTGVAHGAVHVEYDTYSAAGDVTLAVIHDDASEDVYLFESGPFASVLFIDAFAGIEVAAGDAIELRVPNSSGSGVTLSAARVQLEIIELSQVASAVETLLEIDSWTWVGTDSVGAYSTAVAVEGVAYRLLVTGRFTFGTGDFASYDVSNGTTHSDAGRVDIGDGSGFAHVEPNGGPYTSDLPDTVYEIDFIGQGSTVGVKGNDSFYEDNGGSWSITLLAL